MNGNEKTVARLYAGLQARDGAAMAACYAPDATFDDPVFRHLQGREVGAMWRMLCRDARDLEVRLLQNHADGNEGQADWEATYTFSRTGRRVVNRGHARFTFEKDRIKSHVDRFPLWKWSRMALGPIGFALGWTPLVRGRIRRDARRALEKEMARAA